MTIEVDYSDKTYGICIDDKIGDVPYIDGDLTHTTVNQQYLMAEMLKTLKSLCENELSYSVGFTLYGVIRVVVDTHQVFKVYINDSVNKRLIVKIPRPITMKPAASKTSKRSSNIPYRFTNPNNARTRVGGCVHVDCIWLFGF